MPTNETSPILATIEQHRASLQELRETQELDAGDRKLAAMDAGDRELAAMRAVLKATPTTKEEVAAMLAHIASAPSSGMTSDTTVIESALEVYPEEARRFLKRLADVLQKKGGGSS